MITPQFNELIKTIKDYAAPTQIPQFQFDELIKTIKESVTPPTNPTPRTSMWFTEVLLFIIMIILVVG